MVRTQLYLDRKEWELLHLHARQTGATISELVRRAVREQYAGESSQRKAAMLAAIGMRKHRRDLPSTERYIRQMRKDTRSRRLKD